MFVILIMKIGDGLVEVLLKFLLFIIDFMKFNGKMFS